MFRTDYLRTVVFLAQNAIAGQYRDSFLGVLWMLIVPLMQVVIFAVVMPLIARFPTTRYPLFLVAMYPLWSFIAGSLIGSTRSLVGQAEILKRCVVSRTVFPVADVLRQFYTFTVSLTVMMAVASALLAAWNPLLALLPIFLAPVLVSVLALAVGLSFLAPFVKDLTEFLAVGMNVMFWLTPVVYPITAVPERWQRWFVLNPFYVLMRPIYLLAYANAVPGWGDVLRLLAVTAGCVAVGYGLYRACRRDFVYYL